MTWQGCLEIASDIRPGDRLECEVLGHTPLHALAMGLLCGPSFGIYREGYCIGAYGINTQAGTIWSLWSERIKWLDGIEVLREVPRWVAALVALSGRTQLHNYVDTRNKVALEWLQMSGAFIVDNTLHQFGDQTYMRFVTRDPSEPTNV